MHKWIDRGLTAIAVLFVCLFLFGAWMESRVGPDREALTTPHGTHQTFRPHWTCP